MGCLHSIVSGSWIVYFVVLLCSISSEAHKLFTDVIDLFNFNNTEVKSRTVTKGADGRIEVNFTLNIDTTLKEKLQARSRLEKSLRMEDYECVFNNTIFTVDGSTVWMATSFRDNWHQYAPEITIAIICGLAALAIFVSSIYLLCMNRKHEKIEKHTPRRSLPQSYSANSLGQINGGFVLEDINGGQRVHTPKSSIGSTRFFNDRDTLYDKLIYAYYEVPPKHMYSFL
ncbi:uncharacterized protein LOC110978188 isoform X2 [Acanthaster planci]|uniref:Uncharacterized protein LOC110978188 isoform X2 n=1 Tax=Acanthaster planci TaxID=133434 RepID=A0A8B7YAE2_ACAPL|nr:uncharacterized protein LOC110978188 isoform X2 [Acanthaster planci]